MSNFIKYPSIENSYQLKTIDFFLRNFPDLANQAYVIEEKLDGANICIMVKPNSEILYHSRNQMLGDLDSFYDLGTTLKKYENELEKMRDISKNYKAICLFYCEYFGRGIQDRVDYGPDKHLRIINVRIDGELKSPRFTAYLLERHDLDHMAVPVLEIVENLEAALNYDPVYINTIYPESNSYSEGIVIKPLGTSSYLSDTNKVFMLKKKNPKFSEKQKRKKNVEISNELGNAILAFGEYITESRVHSVFSKEGRKIKDKSELGYFIKLVIEDAIIDYNKENDNFSDDHKKYIISSASKKCASILLSLL